MLTAPVSDVGSGEYKTLKMQKLKQNLIEFLIILSGFGIPTLIYAVNK